MRNILESRLAIRGCNLEYAEDWLKYAVRHTTCYAAARAFRSPIMNDHEGGMNMGTIKLRDATIIL